MSSVPYKLQLVVEGGEREERDVRTGGRRGRQTRGEDRGLRRDK